MNQDPRALPLTGILAESEVGLFSHCPLFHCQAKPGSPCSDKGLSYTRNANPEVFMVPSLGMHRDRLIDNPYRVHCPTCAARPLEKCLSGEEFRTVCMQRSTYANDMLKDQATAPTYVPAPRHHPAHGHPKPGDLYNIDSGTMYIVGGHIVTASEVFTIVVDSVLLIQGGGWVIWRDLNNIRCRWLWVQR